MLPNFPIDKWLINQCQINASISPAIQLIHITIMDGLSLNYITIIDGEDILYQFFLGWVFNSLGCIQSYPIVNVQFHSQNCGGQSPQLHPQMISDWWYTYPSEKHEFVSWDDDIPNIWTNQFHVPNHQPDIVNFVG